MLTVPLIYLEMKERRMKRKIMMMFMKMRKLNYLKKRKKMTKKHKLKTFQYFLDYTPGSLDYWGFVIKRNNKLLTLRDLVHFGNILFI